MVQQKQSGEEKAKLICQAEKLEESSKHTKAGLQQAVVSLQVLEHYSLQHRSMRITPCTIKLTALIVRISLEQLLEMCLSQLPYQCNCATVTQCLVWHIMLWQVRLALACSQTDGS